MGLFGLIGDQVIKMFGGDRLEMINNRGVAWGWGVELPVKFLGLSLLIVTFFMFRKSDWGQLVIWGGLSNLIDRFRVGAVIDYLNFFWWFKYNLADGLIVLGAMGVLYNLVYGNKKSI